MTDKVVETDRIGEIALVRAEKVELLAKANEELAAVQNTDEIKAAEQAVALAQKDLDDARAKNEAAMQAAEERRDEIADEIKSLETELNQLTAPQKVRKSKSAAKSAVKSKEAAVGQRGYKKCPKCNVSVPSRKSTCIECGHEFVKGVVVATDKKAKDGRGRRGTGQDLATYVIMILAKYPTGLTLANIVQKVLQAGYKTASQNLTQAVYNVLGKLKKDGKIIKDEETKKFKSHAA